MKHAPQQSTRAAIAAAAIACSLCTAAAQTSLQEAMFRVSTEKSAPAEDNPSVAATSVASALQQLAGKAAVIFTGRVTTVAVDTNGGAAVKFTVEQGIRGISSGAEYTTRISAWAGGADRYYPGERALFLLTAPSISGYSAPVMGERGVVPLTGDALVGNLDLRWIATDVQRGTAAQDESTVAAAHVRSAAVAAPQAFSPAGPSTLPDVHAIDRDLVLDLLRSSIAAPEQTR